MSWFTKYTGLGLPGILESIDSEGWFWATKRLSGNDTNLTGAHQVGLYLPRWFFEAVVPEICTTESHNPEAFIASAYLPAQDSEIKNVRAIYYNSKYFPDLGLKKKYDEFRLTRWGGKENPLQNPDNTGAIALIACRRIDSELQCLLWVTSSIEEEDAIEAWLGFEIMPKEVYGPREHRAPSEDRQLRRLITDAIKSDWKKRFPTGDEIFKRVLEILPQDDWRNSVDTLLLKRRSLEYSIYLEVERQHVLPAIEKGFRSVDKFIGLALSVANRRKSRTGRSLELNLAAIFRDAGLNFDQQKVTESHKKPDFLFPSIKAYRDRQFPAARLQMMAAKTCCKDRWRQIISEANRITPKHLFTLQEGISENQLQEMEASKIVVVVPEPNVSSFPKLWRSKLMHLQGFVGMVKSSQSN